MYTFLFGLTGAFACDFRLCDRRRGARRRLRRHGRHVSRTLRIRALPAIRSVAPKITAPPIQVVAGTV